MKKKIRECMCYQIECDNCPLQIICINHKRSAYINDEFERIKDILEEKGAEINKENIIYITIEKELEREIEVK